MSLHLENKKSKVKAQKEQSNTKDSRDIQAFNTENNKLSKTLIEPENQDRHALLAN